MRKFIAITTAVLLSVVSANAQYKMKVIQDDGSVSEFVVSKIKEVIWENPDNPINPEPGSETHEWVDLGLPSGTKWATCNVGANSPEEYGDYYAWGETETKDDYSWGNYKWCNVSDKITYTKYCTNSGYGTVDNKTVLDPEDDVAHVKWGGNWRIPTDAELTELKEKCTWTWTTQNGKNGYKVTSKSNGNYIFLPAAGYRDNSSLDNAGTGGYYWSASLDESYQHDALNVYFGSSSVFMGSHSRCFSLSIRPVCSSDNVHEYVDLGLSVKWATCNVGAFSPEGYGDYYAWGETETKSYYDWSTYKLCNGSDDTMNKYCNNIKWGTVDNKTVLDPEDDVAHVKWGGSWRMPTYEELKELEEKCKWIWTSQNGTSGYKVISNITGNYIFLPAAGYRGDSSLDGAGRYGRYWSASLGESRPDYAWYVNFGSGGVSRGSYVRCCGRSVRPVCP